MSGHSFNPTDPELIALYLDPKINGTGDERYIKEVNMWDTEPADIPGLAKMSSDHTWHVISRVKKLGGKQGRVSRASKTGTWKVTGRNSTVKDLSGKKNIGSKTYLLFKEKGNRSSSSASSSTMQQNKSIVKWIMHEYRSYNSNHLNKDDFVLYKIMRKSNAVIETPPVLTDLPPVPVILYNIDDTDFLEMEESYKFDNGDVGGEVDDKFWSGLGDNEHLNYYWPESDH